MRPQPRISPVASGTDRGLLDQLLAPVGGSEPLQLFSRLDEYLRALQMSHNRNNQRNPQSKGEGQ